MAKKLISPDIGPNLGPQNFYSWFLPLPVVRYCFKLSLYAISIKNNNQNSRKWRKTPFSAWHRLFGPKFGPPIFYFFFQKSGLVNHEDAFRLTYSVQQVNTKCLTGVLKTFCVYSDNMPFNKQVHFFILASSSKDKVLIWASKYF